MLEIRQVLSKKQQNAFIQFPIKLYEGNKCFAPPLNIDEKKIFKKNYAYNDTCESIFYLAYRDDVLVGRISGIIQHASNEKWGQNRVRFTRFDAINDQEVATALFEAVEKWAKQKGISEMVGPLGYSDLEREGLLIEGFDQLSTFEEQYNYEYYQTLIENCGFVKEIDWLEHKLYVPKERDERLERISKMMLQKYNLRLIYMKSINKYIKRYAKQLFDIIDTTYSKIYGTVPLSEKVMKTLIGNFKLLLTEKNVATIVDENDQIVAFSLCFPSISKVVQKSKGRITLPMLFDFFKTKKNPEIIELGLIGVIPKYESKGIATAFLAELFDQLSAKNVDHMETNLILENNAHSMNLLKHFDKVYHKRRRSYVKQI